MNDGARGTDLLLVDDNPMNLGVLSEILRAAGHRVRVALTGRKALEAARLQAPDLVLMDITMPEMDGYQACEALKADPALARVPVIFLSAHDDPLDKVRAFSMGGADYVQKPFHAPEVLVRIDHQLRLAALQAALEGRNRELQESNARLAELDDLKSRFAAMLVHDLRNPLGGVNLALELLESEPAEALVDVLPAQLQRCRSQLERCLRFLDDLLQVYRADARGLELRPQPIDAAAFLGGVLDGHRGPARQAGIELALEAADGLPALPADPVQLERVLDNLLSNALKFTPTGGHVTLAVDRIEGDGVDAGRQWIRIQVRDTGRGIPAEALPFVFDPYRQTLARDAARGSGLGLAIVARIVAAHHGRASAQSQPDVGTAFTLLLPC